MANKQIKAVELANAIAKKTGLDIEQIKTILRSQAEIAYEYAEGGVTIPGIGTLKCVVRPAQEFTMRFGPDEGMVKRIPESRAVKFLVSKRAKLKVLNNESEFPDIFEEIQLPGMQLSTEAITLEQSNQFIQTLIGELIKTEVQADDIIRVYQLSEFYLSSDQISASDAFMFDRAPFKRKVVAGRYEMGLIAFKSAGDERIAFSMLRFSSRPVARWEVAEFESGSTNYGVDSGTGSFCDAAAAKSILLLLEEDIGFNDQLMEEMNASYSNTRSWIHMNTSTGSYVAFSSGYGDGSYTSYFALDEDDQPVALVTDFKILKWSQSVIENESE